MVFFCSLLKYLLFVVAFVELINTSARVNVLLLARIERMALAANVHFHHVALFGGTGNELGAASAFHGYFVVIGMYILFHSASFSFFSGSPRAVRADLA